MGAPWTVKKYIDDVFTKVTGLCMPAMVVPAKIRRKIRFRRPGTGQKIYAFSDLERPMEAFTEKDQFFHGVGVDGGICRSIKQTNSLAWNRCRHLR